MLESLLGPNETEPDLTRRCDIMLPDADVTMFGLAGGSGASRSRGGLNRGELASVGVGGVFTIKGAACSPVGGVLGLGFVSIC